MQIIRTTVDTSSRVKTRVNLVSLFLKETPGTPNNPTRYSYHVESLPDGDSLFLKRPAFLNKGFDFTVNIQNTVFTTKSKRNGISITRRTTQPSHAHILDDLIEKKKESGTKMRKVVGLIKDIYECNEPDWKKVDPALFKSGHNLHIILKSIKWLFIEQDVTYWNWTGRGMFYSKLEETLV